MGVVFDPETLDRLRSLPPRQAFEEVRDAVYRCGAASSADFLDAFDELVERGILTWDQVEEFTEP